MIESRSEIRWNILEHLGLTFIVKIINVSAFFEKIVVRAKVFFKTIVQLVRGLVLSLQV